MTAVVDTSPSEYHKQSSRYHYQVPPEEDDLESQPSVPRVIQTAVGPKQPEWRKIQQKTFTNWVNERLNANKSSSSYHVTSLRDDLADGVILAKLLEVLSQKKVRGVQKSPALKAHYIDNLVLCLDFIRQVEGVKLVSIHPEEIYKGNMTIIMGLVWTMIQKYQIKTSGVTVTTRRVMMDWLRAMLPEWNITNLTTDFNDGRALLVLLDRIKPGLVPVKTLDPTKRRNNCALAINQARIHLKVPAIISNDDLSNPDVDELSTMTYLSQFLQAASTNLLKWVRKTIPGRTVKNLTTDWNDGTRLAALLETKFPGTIPDANQMSPEDARENIERCFEVAEQRIGILPNMRVEELMSPTVDELPVMTLLTYIRYGQLSPLPDLVKVYGNIGDEYVTVGQLCRFTVDTTEAGPGKLFIDAYYETSGSALQMEQTKVAKGVYVVKYTPSEAGRINFDVLWSDTPVPNSPFLVEVEEPHPVKLMGQDKLSGPLNVDQPVELTLDASNAPPGGRPKAYVQYGFGPPVEAAVTDLGNGKYTLRFVPPNEGVPKLHVTYGGKELEHLRKDLRVVDYKRFSVLPVAQGRQYKTFERVEFGVRSDGPSLDNLRIMAICGDVQVPLSIESQEGHVGTVSFTPTMAGIYSVEVACGDRLVSGTPFLVEVIDPSQINLENELPRYLHIGVPFEFKLDTRNAGPGVPNVSVEDRALEEVFDVEIVDDDQKVSGTIIRVTPKEYGEFVLSLAWSGSHITGSPFRVAVCDPSRCEVSGDIADRKAYLVGRPILFNVSTREAWINDEIEPVVTAVGPSAKHVAEVKKLEDCRYQVMFTPYEVGPHQVSVKFGEGHVPNSPFNVNIMTVGGSGACTATGPGLRRAYTGIPATFQILASQAGLVEAGIVRISVTGAVNKKECKVRVRDNQNGTYDVAYLTEVVGAYFINITNNERHIPGSPFKLDAQLGPDPSKCAMGGPALQTNAILQIGKPIDFWVDSSKAGHGAFQVKAVGPKGVQARVYLAKSDKPNVQDVRVDPIRHGKYRVSARFGNKHIPSSPFMIKVYPGADPTKCKASGPGLQDGNVGDPGWFIIETRDAGAGTLQVRLHGVKDAFKIDIKPKDSKDMRTLEARYDATKPGDYLITIKWSDVHIPGSPFRVKLVGDPVDSSTNDTFRKPTPYMDTNLGTIDENEEDDAVPQAGQQPKQKTKAQPKSSFSATLPRDAKLNVEDIPTFNPVASAPYEQEFDKKAKAKTLSARSSSTVTNFSRNAKSISEKNNMIYNTYKRQEQVDRNVQAKMPRSRSFQPAY